MEFLLQNSATASCACWSASVSRLEHLLHADADGKLVVIEGLEEFREHLGGRLTITLLHNIGDGFEVNEMNLPMMDAIHELQERAEGREDSKIIPALG